MSNCRAIGHLILSAGDPLGAVTLGDYRSGAGKKLYSEAHQQRVTCKPLRSTLPAASCQDGMATVTVRVLPNVGRQRLWAPAPLAPATTSSTSSGRLAKGTSVSSARRPTSRCRGARCCGLGKARTGFLERSNNSPCNCALL